jgi:hypothetical protein
MHAIRCGYFRSRNGHYDTVISNDPVIHDLTVMAGEAKERFRGKALRIDSIDSESTQKAQVRSGSFIDKFQRA